MSDEDRDEKIYENLKRLLRKETGKDIRADQSLRADLRFSERGLRAFTETINHDSELKDLGVPEVTEADVVATETVDQLAKLLQTKAKPQVEGCAQ